MIIQGKNNFAKVFKNLDRYKIILYLLILLDRSNNNFF